MADTPAPQPGAPVAVRADGTPALVETDGKPYRTHAFLVDLSAEQVHGFSCRFSHAQEMNTRLLEAGVISKADAAAFPAYSSDHFHDMVKGDANVQRRHADLCTYFAAVLSQPAVLTHPELRGIVGFDLASLSESYLEPFELAKVDPSLLRRAVAFFRASY